MEAYLTEPRTSDTKSLHAKGPLLYWEAALQTRPRLARMALDFLSAPASFVDPDPAFSCGRLQVNHLQHNMSSQTFKAQMAKGSWAGTPFMPNLDIPTSIIAV